LANFGFLANLASLALIFFLAFSANFGLFFGNFGISCSLPYMYI
jgi:hypothetical protein